MVKTTLILGLILFLISKRSFVDAQHNNAQAAFYNIGTGALVSGVGALINKKPEQKGLKIFLNGMAQGAFGGALVYGSKQMIYSFGQTNDPGWAWGSKLVNAAGLSIIENAGYNRKFLSTWRFNLGFNRIEINTEHSFRIRYKMMPFALTGFIYASTKGSFDLKQTLRIGQPFFYTNSVTLPGVSFEPGGFTIANSIVMTRMYSDSESIAHEIIHAYQYEGDGALNPFFNNQRNKWLSKDNWANRNYKKWIYTDVNFLINGGLYYLGSLGNNCYFDNPYEQEANFYSQKLSCSQL